MNSLKGEANFDTLFKKGKRLHHNGISLVFLKSEANGVAVCTRGMPLATMRNRRKRILRAALIGINPKPGYMIAVFANDSFEKMKLPERRKAVVDAFKRAKLV